MTTGAIDREYLAEVYHQAADLIRRGGLAKNSYERGDAHCTVGALCKVIGRELMNEPEVAYLADLIGPQLCGCGHPDCQSDSFGVVTIWNDREETSAADVVALLEQAAEKLEADR